MRRVAWLAALLWLSLPAMAQADGNAGNFRYRFGGYFKTLETGSRSYFTREAYGDSLNRLRLSFDGRWKNSFSLHIDYDNELHFGNLIGQPDFALVRGRQDGLYLDLLHVWTDQQHAYWDTSLYRGYVRVRAGRTELTVGRQRIAWGTAHFWSPADAFNPISPLQVEADERQGVDAAQLSVRLPGTVRWSVVYAPQRGLERSTEATRVAATIRNYDVAAFAGRFARDWVAGGTFAGQWGGAGLRGELTYTWRGNPEQANALRLTFGSDYQLSSKLYVVGEYFYNQGQPAGAGAGQGIDPSVLLRFTNEIFTLDRHFLSAGARYAVTPLFHLEGYAVADLTGPGVFFMPVATYSLTANTDLKVGGELFASSASGEFHGVPGLAWVELVRHF